MAALLLHTHCSPRYDRFPGYYDPSIPQSEFYFWLFFNFWMLCRCIMLRKIRAFFDFVINWLVIL